MYFVVDGLLIGLFVIVLYTSIRRGLSGHFVFGILRTLIGIAAGGATVFGVYMLMTHFSWLDYMADGVVKFFGEIRFSLGGILTSDAYRLVCGIIAFLPFALIFFIVGYLIGTKLICGLIILIFYPLRKLRSNSKIFRFLDNILGIAINLALYAVVVLGVFAGVYVFNYEKKDVTAEDGSKKIEYVLRDDVSDLSIVKDDKIASRTVHNLTAPMLNGLNESFIAAPLGSYLYENNPIFLINNGYVYDMIYNAAIKK